MKGIVFGAHKRARVVVSLSLSLMIGAPAFAQTGLSDWQSAPTTPSNQSPPPAFQSAPPGTYLNTTPKSGGQKADPFAERAGQSTGGGFQPIGGQNANLTQMQPQQNSSAGSSNVGLSGWQTSNGSSPSNSSGGMGLSGFQPAGSNNMSGGSSAGQSGSSSAVGLSGWQSSGSTGSSAGMGVSGWQTPQGAAKPQTTNRTVSKPSQPVNNGGYGVSSLQTPGSSSGTGGYGLSPMQSSGQMTSNAPLLGEVLQQEQQVNGGGGVQLQGGVQTSGLVDPTGGMGSGMGMNMNGGMNGGMMNGGMGMNGGMMNGGMMNGGVGMNGMGMGGMGMGGMGMGGMGMGGMGMGGMGMGGMGGGMGGLGGAAQLIDVLMNVLPNKNNRPGMGTPSPNGTHISTKSRGGGLVNPLRGVDRTINKSINRSLNIAIPYATIRAVRAIKF